MARLPSGSQVPQAEPVGRAAGAVNILVVDDHPDKLLVYQTVLAELGENIVTASSGEEALKCMLHSEFAVVLLDVNMPVMDGFETAALIRGRRKLAHTPIIFVTAFGDEIHSAQGYSLGAVDYILTPIVPDVLRTKVQVFVQLYRMTAQIKQQGEDRVELVREQAARAAAEDSIRRSAFLAEVSQALSTTLGFEATGKRLTEFVVPFMAQFCALATVDDSGQVHGIKLAWMSSKHGESTRQTASVAQLLDDDLKEAIARSLQTGNQEQVALHGRHSAIRVGNAGRETNNAIDALQLDFAIEHATVFPLFARGRKLGALLLGSPASRPFGPTEQALASEFAGRVAISLDNALLYSRVLEADRRKDEFLAMLAHELRNPLAPIRNAVEIMRLLDSPGPAHDEVCEVIGKEVSHLSRLVDDLLDVSRITRGKITLQLAALDLRDLLSMAAESQRPLLDSFGQTLELSLPEAPLWVQGDPVRLTQVIVNLVDNAAKFTPEGGRLWVVAERRGGQCELKVGDDGIGISSELLPVIFNLFTQGERSLDRRQGGLGIGLSLVKDLVEMHGGSVQASSGGIGKGSEFVVRLPLLEHEPVADVPAAQGPPHPESHHRILVVDDHVGSATTLAMLLRMYGHEVETAHSGHEAIRVAARFHPRIALLDIGLPGMDGYELATHLLQSPETKDALLVAMTGYGQADDRRRSAEAGFHHHLVKPVEPDELMAIIESLADAATV